MPLSKIKNYFQYFKQFLYLDTYGNISIASFIFCVITGVFLAIPYDVKNPYDSVAYFLLTNSPASFTRGLHYWSAQSFLIFTCLHIWDHLKQSTEKKVKGMVWFRLTISIIITFFIMLSGFILKGDADSLQARRIITSLIETIPMIGKAFAYSLFGAGEDFQIIYVHHIATATIFLVIIIVEHSKTIFGNLKTFLSVIILSSLLAYLFIPSLHDNLNPIIKGPWYFLGIQEILYWLSYPVYFLLLLSILFLLIFFLPKLSDRKSKIFKHGILIVFVIYFLTLNGYYFRGENWKFILPWKESRSLEIDLQPISFFSNVNQYELLKNGIPKILGRYEGCLYCHKDVKGLSVSHNPEAIGCASCHLGNPFTLDKDYAHKGMILIPGNLKTAKLSCGNAGCHPQIIEKVKTSIMTTMSGVISVDKFVFDEVKSPDGLNHINAIGHSAAESHIRNLCASCHIGGVKNDFGPIDELSRGGGCSACHLNYSNEALKELQDYRIAGLQNSRTLKYHPDISIKITNDHCFGCHSRSGRISTNYEGWHETQLNPNEVKGIDGYRILQDERVFKFVEADVHYQQGMDCIDCHISYEVMGDGNIYQHKEEQVKIECFDCHSLGNPKTISIKDVDFESKKIAHLRKYDDSLRIYLANRKSGYSIINTFIDKNGIPKLITKNSGKVLPLKPPKLVCVEGKAHRRLSCTSCHTSWAPQCIGCHTEYNPNSLSFDLLGNKEVKGEWIEKVGEFLAESPSLGVKIKIYSMGKKKEVIDNFIPGMVTSIDKTYFKSEKDKINFKRLYAPAFSHAIVRRSRTCESCHNNPLALGYGRGNLVYRKVGKSGKWNFTPKYTTNKFDGLPEDAWIGFLQDRSFNSTTRSNTRPFSTEEQKKILTVGACLKCHRAVSNVGENILKDWATTFKKITSKCLLPTWK